MAEEFEPFRVPQQSSRDKLRILEPLYNDPSSINFEFFPNSYMDPVQENTNFLYNTPQNLRFLENSISNNHQGLCLSLSSRTSTTANNDIMSKESTVSCTVPFGPFTGYSLILKRSRFLKPAEMLLEELLCDVGIYAEKLFDDDGDGSCLMEVPDEIDLVGDGRRVCSNGDARKKSRLVSMLHEVYQKYKQYYQQLQMVVASFESVAGLGNAAPFANLALKAMSKHFKCLKDSITDRLQFTSKSHSQLISERSVLIPSVAIRNAGFVERSQPVWKPQRGLPERAVMVLRAWLFDHFLHPYPTDTDKVMLARQTGLSRNQVSNWFINARVRLWKPMVEEIHNLETREAQKSSQKNEGQNINNIKPIEHFPHACDQITSTSAPEIQDIPSKRTQNDSSNIPIGIAESVKLSYGNMSSGTGGVSLTLGLHHQNSTGNIGLSEPFPVNAARCFGIDANNIHSFNTVSGFAEQNGHEFGRNVVTSGQFLHEFAG